MYLCSLLRLSAGCLSTFACYLCACPLSLLCVNVSASLSLSYLSPLAHRLRLARGRPELFELLDDVHAVHDAAENHVLTVQPWAVYGTQEELATVRVGPRVRLPKFEF